MVRVEAAAPIGAVLLAAGVGGVVTQGAGGAHVGAVAGTTMHPCKLDLYTVIYPWIATVIQG